MLKNISLRWLSCEFNIAYRVTCWWWCSSECIV